MSETRLPENYKEIDLEMSNFDHVIDAGFEDALKNGEVYGRHSAWDFNGKTWYQDGSFHTEVWRYRSYEETISNEDLRELMTDTNDKYGYD